MPINVIQGLPHFRMETDAAEEFDTLPHVVLTKGGAWDPSDCALMDGEDWVNEVKQDCDSACESPFDEREECN